MTYEKVRRLISSITPQITNEVMTKPSFRYDNPLNGDSRLYKVLNNVEEETRLTYMTSGTSIVLQPYQACKYTPLGSVTFEGDRMAPCRFQVFMEQCLADIIACLQGLMPRGENKSSKGGGIARELYDAALSILRSILTNNIYQVSWFGDRDFDSSKLSNLPQDAQVAWTRLLRKCNGLMKDAMDGGVFCSDLSVFHGNVLPAGASIQIFDDLIEKQEDNIEMCNIDESAKTITVTRSIFRNYEAYLCETSNFGGVISEIYRLFQDGQQTNMLKYKGYAIVQQKEWDHFYAAICNQKNTHAAILSVNQNFCIGNNLASSEPQLITSIGAVPKEDFVYTKGDFKLATKVAYKQLAVGAHSNLAV